MLNLNVQIGLDPLEKHKPIYFKSYEQLNLPYSFTVGQDGEILAWRKSPRSSDPFQSNNPPSQSNNPDQITPTYFPVYYMIPSLNGDHEKCLGIIITQLRLISQEQKTYKLITYHTDNRLRIWEARDGSCINISTHNFFPQKIIGLCQNTLHQTRFIFAFSQNSIFIVDCWTMTILDKLEPKKQVYSQFIKGRINQKKQLQLYDNYHKSYRLDVSKLFKESLVDVGRTINSLEKVQRELSELAYSLHEEKLVLIHKIWRTEDFKTPLSIIIKCLNALVKKSSGLQNVFDDSFLSQNPSISKLLCSNSSITVENLFFIKGTQLWYFIGTEEGKIYGFPVVQQNNQEYYFVQDVSHVFQNNKNPVKYLRFIDNFLVCSWQNGSSNIYSTDNLLFMVDQQLGKLKNQRSEKNTTNLYTLNLQQLCISKKKFSTAIKHSLPIYMLSSSPNVNSTKLGFQQIAFQLQNNQTIIFDSLHHQVMHFMGIEEKKQIYLLLYLAGSNQYVGIATEDSIEVFGPQGFERTISYKDWEWKQWNLVNKYECKNDFNSFQGSKGLSLIEYTNRHTINQIDYTSSVGSLTEETFGSIDTQSFSNELYLKFYFLQKLQTQKTLHSRSMHNYVAVLKHKHNSYRRDLTKNTSFFVNCSLNNQLDLYSSNTSKMSLEQTISENFVFYSCFFWDVFEIPFLTGLMKRVDKKFVLKRRFSVQGIGKTLTVYFNNEESVFGLSKYLLTEYAIAAISFMQCYVLKQIEKADDLVSVVQFFTLRNQAVPSIYISGEVLSKSIISSNQNIVKACINLLISTIIAGHINIHPLYEYFVLNLKNIEEELGYHSSSKNNPQLTNNCSTSKQVSQNPKQLTEIQCEWLLYLGLGLIYGKGSVQKQQIKMLLNRILECIELQNFVRKPDLVQVVLKLLNQGLNLTWNQFLTKQTVVKLYLELFRVFFLYDGIGNISQEDKKFNFCFQNNPPQQIKRMKQSIIKTIVFLSKEFNNEFIKCLTTETTNQKPHMAYPASVIQILRQYIKSEKPTTYLVFYIQLLLQCLSPMTPNLRKYVQKNVISTLQFMCTYKSVSFNQSSQRLSIKSNNHLYIYCLRTSTKWRTISLIKQEGKQEIQGVRDEDCVLQMSPKGNYIALLTYKKVYVWRLSSGFWSGLLGAFSQRESFEIPKGGKVTNIVWEQNENSITLVNQDPSLNKAFRI